MDWRDWRPPDVVTSGRAGVDVTVGLVALVVIDMLLRSAVPGPVALAVLGVIALAGVAGHRLDWAAIATSPLGTAFPYLWTTTGMIGWAVYVGLVGPSAAHRLVLVLAAAVVASAVGYPLRGQLAMYGLAFASLVLGFAWAGVDDLGASVLLQAGLLGTVALVSSLVSGHLRAARRRAARSRAAAERRAQLLQAVASLSQLDSEEMMQTAVEALRDLGFAAAAVNVLDDGRLVPHAHVGFPDDRPPGELPPGEGVAGRTFAAGRTTVIEDYQADPDSLDHRPEVGSVVATPIPGDGRPAGVVLGVRSQRGAVPPLAVEVVETVARQAGRMLANAERYDAEQATAARLAELNETKSALLASVSSELRAPLTMVQGLGETLHHRPDLLDDDRALIERLNAHARALSDKIHDLLDFTRLQSGRYELRGEPVDLAVLARDAAPPSVEVEAVGTTITIGDRRLLDRAIRNLLQELQTAFEPRKVRVDGRSADDAVHVSIGLRRTGTLQASGAIGVTLASEILATHGAEIDLDDGDGEQVTVSFSLHDLVPASAVGNTGGKE
ncbi:MAG: GAF domain-containing sensor histidine kinase [Nitriliruptorales bacterium]|nr:GAF domain-containing sensor histidine kinase [Nitriliruptorales bacterium]